MCNRARMDGEPETLRERFGADWPIKRPTSNRSDPRELVPYGAAYVVRQAGNQRFVEAMNWDLLNRGAAFAMTNVRNLALPQWRRLAENPEQRCIIPLTEFAEWTPKPIDLKDGKKPLKGEMWFQVTDQPIFAVAGFFRQFGEHGHCAMVTCDANELVAPIHPKAMITILPQEHWDRWLTCSYDEAVKMQCPYPADRMEVRGPIFPTREQEGSPQ